MLHRVKKPQANGYERSESVHEFLLRELPPGKTGQAQYLANALVSAGARYDRYNATRQEWMDYAARGGRLRRITMLADALASQLCELDILSRDDLESRVDPKGIDTLVGSLRFIGKQTADLANKAQEIGRRRDLAEERWILELADIYENAFGRPSKRLGVGRRADETTRQVLRALAGQSPSIVPPPWEAEPQADRADA